MSSPERVRAALRRQQPDRVPMLEFVVDEIYPLLEMIVGAGADGINPIEPVAGMDLKTVKRLVGERVCILGNIDCARLLP
jgi:uroporphyrinogen-III decarboxylase